MTALLPRPFILAGCFLLLWTAPLLRAFDSPTSFVLNLPFEPNTSLPAWLGHPETPVATFAKLDVPIAPLDPDGLLLVTIYFQEKEGGFLRITWKGADGDHLLSDNFYEGIGMHNQRSLFIPSAMLQQKGTLSLQSGAATLDIQRIKLEWLASKVGLVSPEIEDVLVTTTTKPIQLEKNLNGWSPPTEPAAWHDKLVTIPITDVPQRIEQGTEFSVQLDAVPDAGRLILKEAGLPWEKRLVVWINQKRAGTITPGVPTLADEGFSADNNEAYVGWRDGALFLSASRLHAGVNTVQFSVEDDAPAASALVSSNGTETNSTHPLAVKEVVLQLDYPPVAQHNAGVPAQASSDPTGPTEDTSTSSTPSGLGMP